MCSFSLCFSAELLVLIAAIFLLVYVTKQQVSKWFTYGSAAIIIVTLIMMICSICCAMCMSHCSQNRMQQECGPNQNCGPQMMYGGGNCHGMDNCSQMMICGGGSCEGMAGCEDMSECSEEAECEGHEGKMSKTIIIEKDTVIKKK